MIVSILYMLVTFLSGGIIAPAALILFVVVDVAAIEGARSFLE